MKSISAKPASFLSKQKYYLGLILIILLLVLWNYIKTNALEKRYEKEKTEMVETNKLKFDSLNTVNMELVAKTFSWAIRSELLRGNMDQINQFFNELVKTPSIVKLQLVNSANSVIEISTDKKDEGLRNVDYINIKGQKTISGLPTLKIVTPISGLNKQIAVFILETNK